MIYIQLIFNLTFILGLILASISSISMWRISKAFAKLLKEKLPDYYTDSFISLANPHKYRNLNEDIRNVISLSEEEKNIKEKVKDIKQRYYLKDSFIEFLIMEIENYKEKVLFWKKLGNLSIKLTLIGAVGSILFIIFSYGG